MKSITPLDTRYVPLVQQRYCCVPACISMVMLRHNIKLLPQELIGYELGLVVARKEADKFWNPKIGKPYPAGYGTNVGFETGKSNPNKAFKRLSVPLKMNFRYINEFSNQTENTEYLKDIQDNDRDVIVCFDWGIFSGNPGNKWGHVCLIDKVDFDKKEIRLIDPGFSEPKWVIVPIKILYKAMKAHTKAKGGGFWELKLINK